MIPLLVLIVTTIVALGCRADPPTSSQSSAVSLSFQIDSTVRQYVPDDSVEVEAYSYGDTILIRALDARRVDQLGIAIYRFHGASLYAYTHVVGDYHSYPNHSSEHEYSFNSPTGQVMITSFDGTHISGTFLFAGVYQVDSAYGPTYIRNGTFRNLPVRVM